MKKNSVAHIVVQDDIVYILVRLEIDAHDRSRVVGATRLVSEGRNKRFWPDHYALFTKNAKFVTHTIYVTNILATRLVSQGKITQFYANGYDAYDAMQEGLIGYSEVTVTPNDSTFWENTLKGDTLIEYYEYLYCNERGKYYGKPENMETFKEVDGSSPVCLVPM